MEKSELIPIVSIIVPCYNYGGLLSYTLDSILEQSLKNWECWIIDDGSTDDTSAVASKYVSKDNRIKYYYQDNKGLSAARNPGIKLSKGRYLQFLDADDLIEIRKLEEQSNYLDINIDLDIVFGEYSYFDSGHNSFYCNKMNEGVKEKFNELKAVNELDYLQAFIKSNYIAVNSPLMRAIVVKKIGYFDENLRSLEDWDYWLRALLAGSKFKNIDFPNSKALIRLHGNSMSTDSLKMLRMNLLVRKKISSLLQKDSPEYKDNIHYLKNLESYTMFYKIQNESIIEGLVGLLILSLRNRNFTYNIKGALYWLKQRSVKTQGVLK